MLNKLFPVYFEVELYIDGQNSKEGGFLYASNFVEAMHSIEDAYSTDLVSCHIELLDTFSLCLPIKKAKKIKEIVDNEY